MSAPTDRRRGHAPWEPTPCDAASLLLVVLLLLACLGLLA